MAACSQLKKKTTMQSTKDHQQAQCKTGPAIIYNSHNTYKFSFICALEISTTMADVNPLLHPGSPTLVQLTKVIRTGSFLNDELDLHNKNNSNSVTCVHTHNQPVQTHSCGTQDQDHDHQA